MLVDLTPGREATCKQKPRGFRHLTPLPEARRGTPVCEELCFVRSSAAWLVLLALWSDEQGG